MRVSVIVLNRYRRPAIAWGKDNMTLTFGTTGMDRATEGEIQAAFNTANARSGNVWTLVSDDSAEYVVVDMDSLYGPMSWLKLHGTGRKVIGLTSAKRSKTPYRLPRPINVDDLAVLLSEIAHAESKDAGGSGYEPAPLPEVQQVIVEPEAVIAPQESVIDDAPSAATPESAEFEPVEQQAAAIEPANRSPDPAHDRQQETATQSSANAPRTLRGWMGVRGPSRRVRIEAKNGSVVLLDTNAGVWHGPKELKSITPCFAAEPGDAWSTTPDDASWEAEARKIGPAQPLVRLTWFGGLLSGNKIAGPYQLRKWPQIEREYPRHFRIATVMMKAAATAAEIAVAAGVPEDEVRDFINANLATGYAVSANQSTLEPPAPTPVRNPPATGGLFGRRKK